MQLTDCLALKQACKTATEQKQKHERHLEHVNKKRSEEKEQSVDDKKGDRGKDEKLKECKSVGSKVEISGAKRKDGERR